MRKYLARLQKKPDHNKRQFALLASVTITLFLFGVWSLATIGVNTRIIAEENEVSPFQSLGSNLAASFEGLKSNFGKLKSGFGAVDFEAEYQEMKEDALDVYGQ